MPYGIIAENVNILQIGVCFSVNSIDKYPQILINPAIPAKGHGALLVFNQSVW